MPLEQPPHGRLVYDLPPRVKWPLSLSHWAISAIVWPSSRSSLQPGTRWAYFLSVSARRFTADCSVAFLKPRRCSRPTHAPSRAEPNFTPRALAAARAFFVRSPICAPLPRQRPPGYAASSGWLPCNRNRRNGTPRLHQGRRESDVAGKPVQLGDHQRGIGELGVGDGLRQFRPIGVLSGLDLGVVGDLDALRSTISFKTSTCWASRPKPDLP